MTLMDNKQLQKVLYGLCRYPGKRDVQIAQELGIARSTFGALKNQLMLEGLARPSYLPNFQMLGCELLAVGYMEGGTEGQMSQFLQEAIDTQPHVVHFLAEGAKGLGLGFFTSYTEYDELATQLQRKLLERDHQRPMKDILFPLTNLLQLSLFDFSGAVNRLFELGYPDPYAKVELARPAPRLKLRNTQRQVLLVMLDQPQATDRCISKITGLSSPTVAKARKLLLAKDLLRPLWLPCDLQVLGVEILTLVHARLDPLIPTIKRIQTLQKLLLTLTPPVFITKAADLVMLAPFRNFSEYQHYQGQFLNQLWSEGLLLDPPMTMLLEVERVVRLKQFKFGTLVEHLLGPDQAFGPGERGLESGSIDPTGK